jgi:type IV pilus assembly protein PilC
MEFRLMGLPVGGWLILIPAPFLFGAFIAMIRQFQQGRVVLDMINLRLPVLGQLTSKVAVTRWTRTLGTLISAGVPILDALNVTRETAGNEVFASMLGKVHNSIRQGDTFAGPLRQSKTVDLLVSNMVAVGEETGDLDDARADHDRCARRRRDDHRAGNIPAHDWNYYELEFLRIGTEPIFDRSIEI